MAYALALKKKWAKTNKMASTLASIVEFLFAQHVFAKVFKSKILTLNWMCECDWVCVCVSE